MVGPGLRHPPAVAAVTDRAMEARIASLPAPVRPFGVGADYLDEKTARSDATLRVFLAGFLSHYPWWVVILYGVRAVFVRFLGMRQRSAHVSLHLTPAEVPFRAGAPATIFRVDAAREDAYWIASATDRHLTARVAILREPTGFGTRFRVITIVHHHHWTGRVYLAAIRPFHHIVVRGMIRAGQRAGGR